MKKPADSRAQSLYSEFSFGDFCYRDERAALNKPLTEFLRSISPTGHLFDIGCGTGFWLEWAVQHGFPKERLCGVDITAQAVGSLHARGLAGVQGNAMELPLRNHVADTIICNGALHHAQDPLRAFEELIRIAKPGARIFLAVYNRWNPILHMTHRLGFPVRYLYWRGRKNIAFALFRLSGVIYQPLALILLRRRLDTDTARTHFMDQVITPYAHFFTKRKVRRYAHRFGCEVQEFAYSAKGTLLTAIIKTPA